MIKINLISEGKTARGAGAAPAMGGVTDTASGGMNNNLLVGLAVLGLLLGGGYWFLKNNALASVEGIAQQKRDEAASLEKIIEEVEQFKKRKEDLESRIALINDLKRNQKVPVRVLDRISQGLPDLVWLDSLQLQGTSIELSGRALNPNAVALFVENIKADSLFNEPILKNVRQQGGRDGDVYSYDMTFTFKLPKPEEEPAAEAPAAAPAQ